MCTFSTQAVLSSVFTSIHPLFSCQKQSWTLYLTILKPQTSYTNTHGLVPLLSVSSAAGICWLYAGKVSGRCKWEGAWGGAGGLGGTTEKVLASGGGAGACREKITVEFTLRYVQVRADVSACSDVYMWCVCVFLCLTLGGLVETGLSMWAMGSRMLKGTNPIWLKRFRHFHQRLDDSTTCQTEETSLFIWSQTHCFTPSFKRVPECTMSIFCCVIFTWIGSITSSVSPCCTESSLLFLAMKS